jgi:hypothetical protein
MKRRVKWSHATIALALIAALAIAAPAIGGSSLKKLVKNEVSKQIGKATGPQGPPGANGTNGTNGTNGADGTARAYVRVDSNSGTDCSTGCRMLDSKGISDVTYAGGGDYCVHATGISSADEPAIVSVDWSFTDNPEGNGSVMYADSCDDTGFKVHTERIATANATADATDTVGFDVLIP